MSVWTYIFRRTLQAVPLVFGIIVLNFALIQLAPGDPALMLAGEAGGTTEEILKAIRTEFGLDKSRLHQLAVYVGKLGTGDLGYSYFYRKQVVELILERLPATILLVGAALSIATVLGIGLGTLAALRPNSVVDGVIGAVSLFGYATPVFWTGIMLILLFSVYLPWFPSHGMATIGLRGGWERAADMGHHLVLPAVSLGLIYIALYSRLLRAALLQALRSDFVRTARAKGLCESRVVLKHALRNSLLPVITVAGIQLGQILAGAVVVETVFAWPGMGRLVLDSILRRDYPLLLGILFFSSVVVIIVNLITDLSYGLLDPRIRHR